MRITSSGKSGHGDHGKSGHGDHGKSGHGVHSSGIRYSDRLANGHMDRVTHGSIAIKLRLSEQYRAFGHGDVARRLGFSDYHHHNGIRGYRGIPLLTSSHHRYSSHFDHHPTHYAHHGLISSSFWQNSFQFHIFGPSYYPRHCWYPRWTSWVNRSWHHHCPEIYDPRPVWCRPVVYEPVVRWYWYESPSWVSLPTVRCGTWVDVEPIEVRQSADIQLLAVRFVDPGHPDEQLGPRFRVWFRNNSDVALTEPFDVFVFASLQERLVSNLPGAGIQVTSIEAGETQSVDLRLPFDVYEMSSGGADRPVSFTTLHALVDANRQVNETIENNNGISLPVADVLPIDPASFESEPAEALTGGELVIAGEGFGPEPGQVLVLMGGVEMEAEILGWYDLGIKLVAPSLPLAGPTDAELIVVRGDGAAANPLKVTLLPPEFAVGEISTSPLPDLEPPMPTLAPPEMPELPPVPH